MGKAKQSGKAGWMIRTIRGAVEGFVEHGVLTQAAALAFYSALSLAPTLVLLVWLLGSLGFDAQRDLVRGLEDLLGAQATGAVESVMESADDSPDIGQIAGWISICVVVFSATVVFAQLQQAMNLTWGVTVDSTSSIWSWFRKRLLSLGMLVSLGFILAVSTLLGTAVTVLSDHLEAELPWLQLLWPIIDFGLPLLVYIAVFMLLIKVLPDIEIGWRDVFFAALTTAALFAVGRYLIGLYVARRAAESAYGAAGSLLAVLLWTYYSSIVVLLGSELAAAGLKASGRRIHPEEHAKPVEEK